MENIRYQVDQLNDFISKHMYNDLISLTAAETTDVLGIKFDDLEEIASEFNNLFCKLIIEDYMPSDRGLDKTINIFIEDRGIIIILNLINDNYDCYLLEDIEIGEESYVDYPYTHILFGEDHPRHVRPYIRRSTNAIDRDMYEIIVNRFRKYHKAPLLDPFNLSDFRGVTSAIPSKVKHFTNFKAVFDYLKEHDVAVVRCGDSYFYLSHLKDELALPEHIIQAIPKVYDTEDGLEFSYICLDHGYISDPSYQGCHIIRDNLMTLIDSKSLYSNCSIDTSDITFVNIVDIAGYSYGDVMSILDKPLKTVIFAAVQQAFFIKDENNNLYNMTFQTTNDYTDFTLVTVLSEEYEQALQMTTTDAKGCIDMNIIYSMLKYYMEIFNYTKYNGFKIFKSFYNHDVVVLKQCMNLSISWPIKRGLLDKILVTDDNKEAYYIKYYSNFNAYLVRKYHYNECTNLMKVELVYKSYGEDIVEIKDKYFTMKSYMSLSDSGFISRSVFNMSKILLGNQEQIEEFYKE